MVGRTDFLKCCTGIISPCSVTWRLWILSWSFFFIVSRKIQSSSVTSVWPLIVFFLANSLLAYNTEFGGTMKSIWLSSSLNYAIWVLQVFLGTKSIALSSSLNSSACLTMPANCSCSFACGVAKSEIYLLLCFTLHFTRFLIYFLSNSSTGFIALIKISFHCFQYLFQLVICSKFSFCPEFFVIFNGTWMHAFCDNQTLGQQSLLIHLFPNKHHTLVLSGH